ncbi:MAG: peptidase M23 [Flavobacteriaceae bacterium]|nr:peptidase M23 [Flavobacteriaceae bacterium]OUV87238.1 MAG: hypothetical protein CBD05_00960 [Flavobacteriaceae bacterium TMED145]
MRYYLLTIFFLYASIINSQNSGDYPLEIPIILSGTFGELRPNHFHAGIDIKTKGTEGFKVYSIGDGYVSRIQITHGGYGKALYIKHDNGQSSVYAHLQKFSPKIEKIVKEIQYSKESYTFRTYPSKDEIRISEKELIGFSGNTGRSFGPHLHYELRDELDRPINPMAFKNYSVRDTIPPVVLGLYYKLIPENSISGSNSSFNELKLKKISNNLFISDTLKTSGPVGFGINSFDRMNNTWNKMGLSNIKTNIDGDEIFDMDLNSFSYDQWRHINTFIDYPSYKNKKIKIQKLYIEEFNPLDMYKRSLGDGVVKLNESNNTYMYSVKLFDFNKNQSEILVPIQWVKQNDLSTRKLDFENMFKVNKDSTYNFKFPGAKVSIEKNSFYTDKIIQIFEENNLLRVDKDSIPLLKRITIKMDVSRYNDSIRNRTYIGRIDENKKSSFVSSKKEENYVIAKVNNLGDFVIKIDSIKPNISVIDISDNQWISNRKNLTIKISDNESGVNNYRGTINDKWILLEYNPMKGILSYDFNDNINRDDAKNVLEIKIEDNVGNEKKLIKTFYRKIK